MDGCHDMLVNLVWIPTLFDIPETHLKRWLRAPVFVGACSVDSERTYLMGYHAGIIWNIFLVFITEFCQICPELNPQTKSIRL